MKTETETTSLTRRGTNDGVRELLMQLCTAVKHLEEAHSRLIAALRPTHDKQFVSEATAYSAACADQLEAVREGIEMLSPEAKAA